MQSAEFRGGSTALHQFSTNKTHGLLVPHPIHTDISRCLLPVSGSFSIGRSKDCDLTLDLPTISLEHCKLWVDLDKVWIEDLGSRNGTFINGAPIDQFALLEKQTVIRIGMAVIIYHPFVKPLLIPPIEKFGLNGQFHTGPIIDSLRSCAISTNSILLTGPDSTEKELAASAIAHLKGKRILAYNCSLLSGESESMSILFGFKTKIPSKTDDHFGHGLIKRARGGVLFLDEVDRLPPKVLHLLFDIIENNEFSPQGEDCSYPTDVTFIMGMDNQELTPKMANDFFSGIELVNIPPQNERIADIPGLFNHYTSHSLRRFMIEEEPVLDLFTGLQFEALCLDGFTKTNVQGIIDLADLIASRINAGLDPRTVVDMVLGDYINKPSRPLDSFPTPNQIKKSVTGDIDVAKETSNKTSHSHYENHKDAICAAYCLKKGNLAATQRALQEAGIATSRGYLKKLICKWRLPDKRSFSAN